MLAGSEEALLGGAQHALAARPQPPSASFSRAVPAASAAVRTLRLTLPEEGRCEVLCEPVRQRASRVTFFAPRPLSSTLQPLDVLHAETWRSWPQATHAGATALPSLGLPESCVHLPLVLVMPTLCWDVLLSVQWCQCLFFVQRPTRNVPPTLSEGAVLSGLRLQLMLPVEAALGLVGGSHLCRPSYPSKQLPRARFKVTTVVCACSNQSPKLPPLRPCAASVCVHACTGGVPFGTNVGLQR